MKKILMLVLLASAAGGVIYWYTNNNGTQKLSEKSLKFSDVRRVTIRDIVSATGYVEPTEIVIVSAEMPGTIAQIYANIGDSLGENKELARLDDRKIKLKVEEADNNVRMADPPIVQAESALAQVRRIYDATDAVAARHPEVEIVKARYLDDHPLVVDTFVERIRGIAAGDINMNCSLCKYRTQVIGFERDLGAPQESHHHHVEGIGTDGGHHHHHHSHDHHHHSHDHHHHAHHHHPPR